VNRSGECIYHQPTSRWYAQIRMHIDKGTRWFCSVDEAEAAGCRETRRSAPPAVLSSAPGNRGARGVAETDGVQSRASPRYRRVRRAAWLALLVVAAYTLIAYL